jgi:hypothetical protein
MFPTYPRGPQPLKVSDLAVRFVVNDENGNLERAARRLGVTVATSYLRRRPDSEVRPTLRWRGLDSNFPFRTEIGFGLGARMGIEIAPGTNFSRLITFERSRGGWV